MARKPFVPRLGNKRSYKTARCILVRGTEFLLARHGNEWTARDKGWGLPGGQVEWRESPHDAARREIEEELNVFLARLEDVGDFHYKRALHKVYCAPFAGEIVEWDDTELREIGWFTLPQVRELETAGNLHAGYERVAVEQAAQVLPDGFPNQPTNPRLNGRAS